MKKTIYALTLLFLSALAAFAQDSTATKGQFTFSGYIDSYYLHAFNNPASGNLMGYQPEGVIPAGRAFDRLPDQFALGLVQTKMIYSNSKSEVVVDLTFGPNAELGNFGNTPVHVSGTTNLFVPKNGYVSSLYGTSAAIKQAYFTYKPTNKLSFTIGQFGTHIGYEVIDAPVNFHYSLSNLFNNGPFYHIGAKAAYAFSDQVSLMVGVVNNWDNLTDSKKQKSFISQLYLQPLPNWNVYLNYIGGHSDDTYLTTVVNAGGNPAFANYTRQLFDLTTGYQITDKFYMGLNAAYGWYHFNATETADQEAIKESYHKLSPQWGGVAVYANYAINDILAIGARVEHFDDSNKVRYFTNVNNSVTITAPINLAGGHLIVKPEYRMDTSPSKYYENSTGNAVNSQQTFGAAFIYKY